MYDRLGNCATPFLYKRKCQRASGTEVILYSVLTGTMQCPAGELSPKHTSSPIQDVHCLRRTYSDGTNTNLIFWESALQESGTMTENSIYMSSSISEELTKAGTQDAWISRASTPTFKRQGAYQQPTITYEKKEIFSITEPSQLSKLILAGVTSSMPIVRKKPSSWQKRKAPEITSCNTTDCLVSANSTSPTRTQITNRSSISGEQYSQSQLQIGEIKDLW